MKSSGKKTDAKKRSKPNKPEQKRLNRQWRTGRIFHLLFRALTLVLVLALCLSVLLYRIFLGPSPAASKLLTMTLLETSALKFVPSIFLGQARVDELVSGGQVTQPPDEMDLSLISVPAQQETGSKEDEKDLELIRLRGKTYKGYLLIVKDPARVFVGTPNEAAGYSARLDKIISRYGAVAGVNANGFEDEGGMGNGSKPLGLVISQGKLVHGSESGRAVGGFDKNNVLRVGDFSTEKAKELGLRDAVAFGPVLIVNGKTAFSGKNNSGLNPRTAIGQRADGAVLLLVLDGRQADSLGATYQDEIDILLKYGAVNALNLDGGTSSAMYLNGERVNGTVAITGTRRLPCAVLVAPK